MFIGDEDSCNCGGSCGCGGCGFFIGDEDWGGGCAGGCS